MSSRCGECDSRYELAIDLASDIAFETSDDLRLGHALLGASSHVGPGRRIGGETHDDDTPERAVGMPVAATVEPVATAGLARGRWQRCHTAEIRERTL